MIYSKFQGHEYRVHRPVRLVRSSKPLRSTHWSPISHVEHGGERLTEDALREELQAGSWRGREWRRAEVQDPYNRKRFIDGFYIHRDTLAVVHSEASRKAIDITANLGKLSVLWPMSRVGQDVVLGNATEVRPQAVVEDNVEIADRTLVSKGARLGRASKYGSMVFIGNNVISYPGVEVASGSHVAKNVILGTDAKVGAQFYAGRGALVGYGALVGSDPEDGGNVYIGQQAWVHHEATIGAGVQVAPYSIIGPRALIGAEAVIGIPGVLQPTAWVNESGWVMPGQVVVGEAKDMRPPRELREPVVFEPPMTIASAGV